MKSLFAVVLLTATSLASAGAEEPLKLVVDLAKPGPVRVHAPVEKMFTVAVVNTAPAAAYRYKFEKQGAPAPRWQPFAKVHDMFQGRRPADCALVPAYDAWLKTGSEADVGARARALREAVAAGGCPQYAQLFTSMLPRMLESPAYAGRFSAGIRSTVAFSPADGPVRIFIERVEPGTERVMKQWIVEVAPEP